MSHRRRVELTYLLFLLQAFLGLSVHPARAAEFQPSGPITHCSAMLAGQHQPAHSHSCCSGHASACTCGGALAAPPAISSTPRGGSISAPPLLAAQPAIVQLDEPLRPPIA